LRVRLETNHGSYLLEEPCARSAGAVLQRHGVPLSAVWTYTVDDQGIGQQAPMARFLSSTAVTDAEEVRARVTRNINLPGLLGHETSRIREVANATTEWVFPSGDGGAYERVYAQMNADDCADFVKESVRQVLQSWPEGKPRRLVVGTSGGGDSNVLLTALVESDLLRPEDVIPVMMLGIPDWDAQLPAAQAICEANGLRLHAMPAAEAARRANVKSIEHAREEFRRHFPPADMEFLGTWLLRRVLTSSALDHSARFVATGLNREDILAEQLSRVCLGFAPLPAPFRPIGDVTFVFPMWKVPKKIGDGAYPKYSLDNYQARAASFSPGRSAYYQLTYAISHALPGMDVSLLNGLSALAATTADSIVYDDVTDDFLCREGSTEELRKAWAGFLQAVKP
jgi:hypothetical protein